MRSGETVSLRFGPRPARPPVLPASWDVLPGEELAAHTVEDAETVAVDVEAWRRGRIDFYRLDARVDELGERGLVPLAAGGEAGPRLELLTRCQRWLDRRNDSSGRPWFDAALGLHWRLHDRRRPLVRADHNHALDAWQWTLRLDPAASGAVQIAALFHDVERLTSESERRVEQDAADYGAFKRSHARAGARRLRELLAGTGAEPAARRAAELVAAGDRAGDASSHDDLELDLLEDADALSFFSLNSDGFLDYYGEEHTVRKIEWTIPRLSLHAIGFLRRIRLRRDVAALLERILTRAP